MRGRVLVVEDDAALRALLGEALPRRGLEVVAVRGAEEALRLVDEREFDVALSDLHLPGMDGLALCKQLVARVPDMPVVVITAFGSLETAIGAIRAGVYDFVPKPFDLDQLQLVLERAIQHRQLRDEVRRLRREARVVAEETGLLGDSPALKQAVDLISRVADTDATVLITGESGTGKELAARALHQLGPRRDAPFVALNCAAVPEALLESELFGHVRGAFTDARSAKTGLLLAAHGGTLFLDEIGDLPAALQPKLLRVLQERKVRPVGGEQELPFDVRLVAATHRDLEALVEEEKFREDLFFRINVIAIPLPPLRARGRDVLLLAQRFIAQIAERTGRPVRGLSPEAAERLLSYPWPGNVRELQNCIERAVALAPYDVLRPDDLPDRVRDQQRAPVVPRLDDATDFVTLDELERRYILRVLEAVRGNRTLAASMLGVDRKTLYRKLERYRDERSRGDDEAS